MDTVDLKQCRDCLRWKPRSEYSPHRMNRDRLETQCKRCRADEQAVRRRTTNAQRTYNRALYRLRDLHREEFDRLLAEERSEPDKRS